MWSIRPGRFMMFCSVTVVLLSHTATGTPGAMQEAHASLRAAIADLSERFPEQYGRGGEFLERLAAFERRATTWPVTAGERERFEELRREALLAHPLLAAHPLIFVTRRQFKPDHHNTATLFQTGEINTNSFEGSGALRALELSPGGTVRTLLESPEGIIRDPVVHFDGGRVLFSMRRNIEDDYHLYEINADGSGLRQLTFAGGVSDIDPLYLPGGDIIFSSTREPKYCMCNRHIMCNLFRMTGAGANIHQIGKSTLFEGHGALMPDGRILYYRWEYVDRNFGDAQGLWTTYPDGANHAVYWGNNTQSPGAVINAVPVPDTQQVLCIFSSCHDRPWGALALIDRRLGVDGVVNGLRSPSVLRTWPESALDLVGEGDVARFNWDTFMQVTPKYEDPFALDEHFFLCSRTVDKGEKTGLFLVDTFGNELLLYAEGDDASPVGCYDPMPLVPSPRPPELPARSDFSTGTGYFYVANVYEGTHLEGVAPGTVKYLRVIESPEKRTFTHPSWDGQGQQAPAMAWHDFNNKRILGTVPVEEDGSAYFSVPAETFLYFQLLDEKGMMVQSMRSGTIVQPGETQGCIGCHEERRDVPPLGNAPTVAALTWPPSPTMGWYGPPRFFSYTREVQPVFNRHCVRCHDYGQEAGKVLNLSGDRDLVFNTSYNELWRKGFIKAVGGGPAQIQPAYTWGSHASRLTQTLINPHYEVQLDDEGLNRLLTWMDINGPYYPEYDSAYPDHPAGRSPLNPQQVARLAELTGIPLTGQLGHGSNQGPQICFERPEHSPCLGNLKETNPPAYEEALQIIRDGMNMLAAHPRADMEGFLAAPAHRQRQEKYQLCREAEARNREAIRKGETLFDRE